MNHAGLVEGPRLTDGLLGMLRPYQGIREQNLHEVIGCIFSLKADLQGDAVDRGIVLAFMTISTTIKEWGTHPRSMLRRNHILDDAALKRLEAWSLIIDTACIRYLSKLSDAVALYHYLEYLATYDATGQLNASATEAAIHDAFSQDDDYKLAATQVCLKYPAIGGQFRATAASLIPLTQPGELRNRLAELANRVE